jgi:hypothetical protein
MYLAEFNEEDLLERIYDFDEEARLRLKGFQSGASVVIMGGGAFILSGFSDRMTCDIDVLTVPQALTDMLRNFQMNTAVMAHVDSLPFNYEDRLVDLPLENTFLHYQRPSLEDLVVTKLYAMRPPDIKDLRSPEVLAQINWELLDHIVYDKDEAKASALNERRYSEMVQAYEDYREEFCE